MKLSTKRHSFKLEGTITELEDLRSAMMLAKWQAHDLLQAKGRSATKRISFSNLEGLQDSILQMELDLDK